jgi:predicted Rossmann-fold nucleotide-binding protein
LPFEQDINAFVDEAVNHRTLFTWLHQFVLTSDAYIVAPNGIGTVLETMTNRQLHPLRHLQDTPLILVSRMRPGLVSLCTNRDDFA